MTTPPSVCPDCGAQVSPALLACPACQRLMHADRLRDIARQAGESDDPLTQLQLWREALDLLPRESKQRTIVSAKVAQLSQEVDAAPVSRQRLNTASKPASGVGQPARQGNVRLLVAGLLQSTTLLTMILAMVVYWTILSWPVAVGLVLSIYVHEMGHVAALRRFGFKSSTPFFIPGLGALIMLKQQPNSPQEDARIGLAGPMWGLYAAIVSAGLWAVTGSAVFGAVSHIGAMINLFNLVPIPPLDGGRGFSPMSLAQRWLCVAALGASWWITREPLMAILAGIGVARLLGNPRGNAGDRTATWQFVFLVASLTALTFIPRAG